MSEPHYVADTKRLSSSVCRSIMSVIRCIRVSPLDVLRSALLLMPSATLKSVSIDRAAVLLQKSRRTIYNRIHDRKLETIRIGVSQRVTLESLYRQPEFVHQQRLLEYLRAHAPQTGPRTGGSPS